MYLQYDRDRIHEKQFQFPNSQMLFAILSKWHPFGSAVMGLPSHFPSWQWHLQIKSAWKNVLSFLDNISNPVTLSKNDPTCHKKLFRLQHEFRSSIYLFSTLCEKCQREKRCTRFLLSLTCLLMLSMKYSTYFHRTQRTAPFHPVALDMAV